MPIDIMVRAFASGLREWGSIPGRVILKKKKKKKKRYFMPPCLTLSIIRYRSRVKEAIQRKELHPLLHPSVVAIEKGAFGLPPTMVSELTKLFTYKSELLTPQN